MELLSLIRENKEQMRAENARKVLHLPIDSVLPNPDSTRREMDEAELWKLSYSIRSYGVMQPVIVRRLGAGVYELISGERRLKASKLAGLKTIPAILFDANRDAMAMNLVENTQRSDLNFVEEARGYDLYLRRYGYTVQELGKKLGKNPYEIENKLRILKLPEDVIEKLLLNRLSEYHANALLRLRNREEQRELTDIIISRGFDVAQTEHYVDRLLSRRLYQKLGIRQAKDLRIVPNTLTQLSDMLEEAGVESVLRCREFKHAIRYTLTVTRPAESEEKTEEKIK